jgi:putative MATE family efflux protein
MSPPPATGGAVFVTGSTMRHVAVMTGTGSVGLMAIFLVDLLSLLYVSWLGRPEATAGVGFASIVLFFAISFNIGLMIGITALMARRIGSGQRGEARRIGGSTIMLATLTGALVALVFLPFLPALLTLLGAKGEAHDIALRFLWIVLPANVLMSLGMGYSAALRAVGDAKRAMYVTLAGGVATAGLDPLLIFGLGLGVDGAAIAVVISRIIFAGVGWHGAVRVHDLVARPGLPGMKQDAMPLLRIAGPAILTNIASPLATAFIASIMSRFGDKAMAAVAVIDRLSPVAFGALFAMSGAVGPILAQNWGAGRHDRMRRALTDSVVLAAAYVLVMWIVLWASRGLIADAFHATDLAADIIGWFVMLAGPMWLGLGALFVANASFNNLGFPFLATAFNWGRATLGAVPLAFLGAQLDGPRGVLIGVSVGALVFGLAAIAMAYRTITRLEAKAEPSRA